MKRILSPMVLIVLAALLTLPVPSAGAAGAGLLVQSDAPPGFGTLHTKVYTTWVKKMKVTTTTTGMGKGASSCDALAGSKQDGLTRSVIQAFDSPSILSVFELCESVFSSVTGASKAYTSALADLTTQSAKVKGMKAIPGLKVGDVSYGVFGLKGNFVNAEALFRHGKAVVVLLYLGSAQYSGRSFVGAAMRANARIH